MNERSVNPAVVPAKGAGVSRVTQQHIDTRAATIRAAGLRLFAHRGIAQTTMHEVAAEAGLSAGAIYRYFPSKDALVQAVFDQIHEENRALFAETAEEAGDPLAALMQAGRIIIERLGSQATRERVIIELEAILADARRSPRLVASTRRAHQAYAPLTEQALQEAQLGGALDPAVDPRGLAGLVLAVMVGVHVLGLELEDPAEMTPTLGLMTQMLRHFAGAERAEGGQA